MRGPCGACEKEQRSEIMKFKLTKDEKKWVMYDVGNSAFTLMISTILPIYFNYLAGNAGLSEVSYLAYWDTRPPSRH